MPFHHQFEVIEALSKYNSKKCTTRKYNDNHKGIYTRGNFALATMNAPGTVEQHTSQIVYDHTYGAHVSYDQLVLLPPQVQPQVQPSVGSHTQFSPQQFPQQYVMPQALEPTTSGSCNSVNTSDSLPTLEMGLNNIWDKSIWSKGNRNIW